MTGLSLLAFLGAAAAPAAPAATPLHFGTQVDWTHAANPRPIRYRSGDVTITISGEPGRRGLVRPVVTVEAPGRPKARMEGALASPIMPNRIGIGILDRAGTPFVYHQSYTGGAHCCNSISVAVVGPDRIRVTELGAWDGEPQEHFPRDEDGDGTIDFVQTDDGFRYAFSSGAASRTPPLVLNIVGGRPVDVPARPGFRHLFEADMAENRAECTDEGPDRNGACAAFVASAARVGRLEEAWAEMLCAHQPYGPAGGPPDCSVALRDGRCPAGREVRFGSFPEALRYFLVRRGYIAR